MLPCLRLSACPVKFEEYFTGAVNFLSPLLFPSSRTWKFALDCVSLESFLEEEAFMAEEKHEIESCS